MNCRFVCMIPLILVNILCCVGCVLLFGWRIDAVSYCNMSAKTYQSTRCHNAVTAIYRQWPTGLHGVIKQNPKIRIFTALKSLSAIQYMYRPSLRHMRSIHGQLLVTCCDVMWYCAHATSAMRLLTALCWVQVCKQQIHEEQVFFESHKNCDLHRKKN
jgi:hypothetical protein